MRFNNSLLVFIFLGLLAGGCGKSHLSPEKSAAPDVVQGPRGEPAQAEWTEKEGLLLPEEMQQHIGLKISVVEKKPFKAKATVNFQVFREAWERSSSFYSQGLAYATVRVERSSDFKVGERIDFKKGGFEETGRIVKVFEIPPQGSMQNEILVEIPDPKNQLKITQFLQASMEALSVPMNLVVPETAVLATPEGTFAYRREGKHYKKIAVETGPPSDGWIAVNKGLEEGDCVVSSPVKTLWLTELQLRNEGSDP